MLHYLIRRLLIGCVTLILITFVLFGLIRNIPGTPLTLDLAEADPSRRISEAELRRMNRLYGLDKPWPAAYAQWMGNVVRGDLGRSFRERKAVSSVIGERLKPTLLLSGTSLFLAYLLAVPIGLWATVRSGRIDERAISTALYMLYSIPSYVAGLLLLVFFYQKLQGTALQLPGGGMTSPGFDQMSFGQQFVDLLKHMILPVTCATYGSLAYYSRFVKSNMEEVVRQDYIRTARAKGVPPVRVILHHAFRNTLIPFVTMIGLTLPGIVSGFVILEGVFSWPGIGQLFLEAMRFRDYTLIMGLTLMFSLLTLAGQLLADILYTIVDPRVTYS